MNRRWLPLLLFVATFITTSYAQDSIAFSATLMAILVSHEMGHYLVARRYGVPASLPHFIPVPPVPIFSLGTLGAVITMRTDQATRSQLLDIGAAGPIAGFLVAVPAMILGIRLSPPIELASMQGDVMFFGDSILTKSLALLFGPDLAPGWDVTAHPVFTGAWAGFLVTAINLLPMGQLDGGHILHAFTPARAPTWMRRVFFTLLVLGVVGIIVHVTFVLGEPGSAFEPYGAFLAPLRKWVAPSALVWAFFGWFTGLRHPPVRGEDQPLTPGRRRIAYACLAILVLCFMPNPLYADRIEAKPTPPAIPAATTSTSTAS